MEGAITVYSMRTQFHIEKLYGLEAMALYVAESDSRFRWNIFQLYHASITQKFSY